VELEEIYDKGKMDQEANFSKFIEKAKQIPNEHDKLIMLLSAHILKKADLMLSY